MNRPNDEELFATLQEMRALYPDWRFGQMICNLATWARGAEAKSVWDIEDRELVKTAKQHVSSRKAQR
jgi:hypothetical protein